MGRSLDLPNLRCFVYSNRRSKLIENVQALTSDPAYCSTKRNDPDLVYNCCIIVKHFITVFLSQVKYSKYNMLYKVMQCKTKKKINPLPTKKKKKKKNPPTKKKKKKKKKKK